MALLTAKELKYYLIGVGFVTILALFVTVLIILLSGGGDSAPSDASGERAPADGSAVSAAEEMFSYDAKVVSRMRVPEPYKALFSPEWKSFRPVQEKWSRDQIAPYWIDPKKIVKKELEKESREAVSGFLEELP